MVGKALGFTWHTGHPAIAVPNEPLDTVLAVADRHGARYLVVDGSQSRVTDDLCRGEMSYPRLVLRYEVGQWQVCEIKP